MDERGRAARRRFRPGVAGPRLEPRCLLSVAAEVGRAAAPARPVVLSQEPVITGGKLTAIRVVFDRKVIAADARKLKLYKGAGAGADGRLGTADDTRLALKRVTYNANTRTATVVLRKPLAAGTLARVAVNTAKLRAAPGGPTDPGAGLTGTVIERADATIYVPKGLPADTRVPVVVAYSAGGNTDPYLRLWGPIADQRGWILYASKEYSNARNAGTPSWVEERPDGEFVLHFGTPPVDPFGPAAARARIEGLAGEFPVDLGRIILTGHSGGGNFALQVMMDSPDLDAAVITNSGFGIGRPGDDIYPDEPSYFVGNSHRLGVLIHDPADPYVSQSLMEMTHQGFLRYGWDTLFIPTTGGHVLASLAVYQQALDWIVAHPSWQRG